MSNTYQWGVLEMACYPEYEGQTDVVFEVNWCCTATNPDSPLFLTATNTGVATLSLSLVEAPFTPYADLTQEQVIGWVQSALGEEGVAAVYARLDAQIQAKITPPVVTPPLPWIETPQEGESN